MGGTIWSPVIASSKTEIDFGGGTTTETFLVWNNGTGEIDYTVALIEGSDCFTVTPTTGSSSGLGDKRLHTVAVERARIPAGETRTAILEVAAADGQAVPLYIGLLASNDSILTVTKSLFKAGRSAGQDSFAISGYLNATLDDIASADSILFRLWSPQGLVYEEELPFDFAKVVDGVYSYKRKLPKGAPGGIVEFRFDLNLHSFKMKGRKADLSGLEAPVSMELVIGTYTGRAEANGTALNKGRLLPGAFMLDLAED